MKSIKEKQLLVKWAKAMNEPIDPALVEEVERYNQLQEEIKESIRSNTINDLFDASKVAADIITKVNTEYPKPPTLEELLSVVQEESNELVQAQAVQAPPVTEEATASSTPRAETVTKDRSDDLISRAADHIHKEVKLEENSFQQPQPTPVDKNFEAVQKKLKFLEQAIGKIAATGPGSGETKFLRLDDVSYSSWQDRDRHKIVKFEANNNPAYDGVTFGFLTGDQGPIYSMKYDTTGYTGNANVAAGLTAWNPDKDCLDIHQADGTILQVGMENYIRVANETGNILLNGEFVVFAGINGTPENPVPKVDKFLADANCIPLYSVGVLTNDIQNGADGRATVLGEVRDIDTTGNVVGETWYAGNLLWAHPGIPGKLTVTQPTAPNVAVSVAAVIKADPTEGVLLVRPTLFPRLYYGEFSSNQNQVAPNTNFGHYVTFNSQAISSGFVKNNGNTEVVALNTGLYNVRSKLQFTSTNASQQTIYIWGRKNGIDIPDSTIRATSAGNGSSNAPIWSRNVSMQAGDKISIMWAVSSTDVTLAATSTAFAPNTSSAVFSIHQIAL